MVMASLRRALLVAGRALRRRCPHCGGSGIFATWFRMVHHCPTCGLALERAEQGYRVGAYMFNIAMAELVFVIVLVAVLILTWPTPPWGWLTYGIPVLMILLPIAFYPYSQTLFLGFDILFHPPERKDFQSAP